ncbi:hypothetical protein [Streptomyces sp. CNQ-509]|uniref:hypothetical protein n=1 Tax=Streptomyces sp. CNQ-509 TaxID=444103 RepID=UPI000699C099|nr:hypothetical protein [Streptomyces sp. CNQ-509]
MNDTARGAAMLKALRRRRGLSLAGTARALRDIAEQYGQTSMTLPSTAGVQRSVARWESARPTRPDDRYQLLLAYLYARTPTGDLALGPGSDFAELLDALAHLGEDTQALTELRRMVLRSAIDRGAGMLALLSPALEDRLAAALANPAQADEDLLTGLHAAVSDTLRRQLKPADHVTGQDSAIPRGQMPRGVGRARLIGVGGHASLLTHGVVGCGTAKENRAVILSEQPCREAGSTMTLGGRDGYERL